MEKRLKIWVLLLSGLVVTTLAACTPNAPAPTSIPTQAQPAIATVAAAVSPVIAAATATAAPAPTVAPSPTVAASPATTPSPLAAASPAVGTPTVGTAVAGTPAATPTPLTIQQLSAIQPGLGTVMIEYAHRMAGMWFAEQAGNWNMAAYQLDEMKEIQEVGETTRPARANALKAFESGFLDPLDKSIGAKDKTQFETAYRNALNGCNACHASQTSSEFTGSYNFVKVQVPKDTLESIYSWTP